MLLELAQIIIDLNRDCGYEDDDIVKLKLGYVGKDGQKHDAAIVGLSACQILSLVIDNADSFVDFDGNPLYFAERFQEDSFGLNTIVY